jgi:tetratricopeptide (TPR) repeat protein
MNWVRAAVFGFTVCLWSGTGFAACKSIDEMAQAPDLLAQCEEMALSGTGTAHERAILFNTVGLTYELLAMGAPQNTERYGNLMVHAWDQAIGLDPTLVDPYVSKARTVILNGRASLAVEILKDAQKAAPNDWRVYRALADTLNFSTENGAALEAGEKAIALSGGDPYAHYSMGNLLTRMRRFGEAAEHYAIVAAAFRPGTFREPGPIQRNDPWFAWADALAADGQYALAAEKLTVFIDSKRIGQLPQMFIIMRGEFYQKAKMYREAAADADLASKYPGMMSVQQARIWQVLMLVAGGQKSEALAIFHDAKSSMQKREILQLQVFLKNRGYEGVKISGEWTTQLAASIEDCFDDANCIEQLGHEI